MEEQDEHNSGRERNPAGKIWAVFFVTLATTVGASYLSYRSFDRLTTSLEQLSRPGEKGNLINGIFQDIIQAENQIHSYILTGDTLSRSKYRATIAQVRRDITQLRRKLEDDSTQLRRVDTLQTMYDLKINYLERFLYVKRLKQSSLFTSEAMRLIAEEMNDTAFIDKQLLKREVVKEETVPVERKEVVITPDEFRGLSGFLRKLFGKDQTRVDTLKRTETATSYTYDIAVDTSIVRDYFRDSTLVAVKNILAMVLDKEVSLQERITETELNLMRQNKVFISNIRMVIDKLRAEEQAIAYVSRRDARQLANTSIIVLSLIGCAGVLMSGIFLFLILRDVTRAWHYRRALEHEKIKAEQLARVKEEFLSNMSHEIRTPLHNIFGFSSLLAQTPLDERQAGYMTAIRESERYLSELVNNVLDQAKVDSGQLQLVKEPFSLQGLVKELMSVYAYAAAGKNVVLRSTVSQALEGFQLVGDGFRIKQVLNNLLSNALKFTEAGEVVIMVKAEQKESEGVFAVDVTVSDTGPGIEPGKLNAIFEPFVQEKPGIARSFGGTGLGLSIARSVAAAMGGAVHACNGDAGGAQFTLSLKLPYVPAPASGQEADADNPTFFADACVLIVEDDRWNARLLTEILQPRISTVYVRHDAGAALAFLEGSQEVPDLVFTDINMPGMRGNEFLNALRVRGYEMPVVAVTAHMDKAKLAALRDEGFYEVCKKPFAIDDIVGILRASLGDVAVADKKSKESEESHPEIDFSGLRAFAGDDDALFVDLLSELVRNNGSQVRTFGVLISEKDAAALADLSHQMRPTYDTIGLHGISESLASMEVLGSLGKMERVLEIADEVYVALTAMVGKLEAALEKNDNHSNT